MCDRASKPYGEHVLDVVDVVVDDAELPCTAADSAAQYIIMPYVRNRYHACGIDNDAGLLDRALLCREH